MPFVVAKLCSDTYIFFFCGVTRGQTEAAITTHRRNAALTCICRIPAVTKIILAWGLPLEADILATASTYRYDLDPMENFYKVHIDSTFPFLNP